MNQTKLIGKISKVGSFLKLGVYKDLKVISKPWLEISKQNEKFAEMTSIYF